MRTPKQTLKKLAEVAPKGWAANYYDHGAVSVFDGTWSAAADVDADDIQNATFTAFLKQKLREMGYWMIGMHLGEGFMFTVWGENKTAQDAKCPRPTEWQAVAEAMIGVLESIQASVQRGIEQSKAGQTVDLGSFAQYVEEESADPS